jgi:hypothetical protein
MLIINKGFAVALLLLALAGVAQSDGINNSTSSSSSSGTVTSVSVIPANGVSGTVGTPTTTPAISLTLGAITPSSVNGNTITTGTGTLTLGSATLNAGAGGTLGSNAFTSTTYAPLASPTFTGTPAAPTAAAATNTTQLATTAFVTTAVANAVAGINPAIAVQAATTQASDTSGLTYNNGVAGIGATFTGSVNTAFTVDGFTFTALNQRVLVKNDTQSPSGAFNGIYYVTQVQTGILPPILTRALDYDQPSDMNNTGAIPVVNGTLNAGTSWLLTSAVATVGTDPLTYTKFSLAASTLPYIMGQSHIPFVLVSSGTMGNNGALSGLTAVAIAYPNAYVWMPAGAISSGSLAGWYYATFSTTQAATVFNNTYTSGTPTIPGSPTAFVTTGPGAYTQTTGSNIAAYTLAIAGNAIGVNGTVLLSGLRTNNNSAGAKIITGNYGAYAFGTVSASTGNTGALYGGLSNRGVANVQVPFSNAIISVGNGGAGVAAVFGAIDSTSAQNLVMNLQLATATDTMTLENIVVQMLPGVP